MGLASSSYFGCWLTLITTHWLVYKQIQQPICHQLKKTEAGGVQPREKDKNWHQINLRQFVFRWFCLVPHDPSETKAWEFATFMNTCSPFMLSKSFTSRCSSTRQEPPLAPQIKARKREKYVRLLPATDKNYWSAMSLIHDSHQSSRETHTHMQPHKYTHTYVQ